MRYFSLGEWFDEGTEALLIDDYRPDGIASGLFEGIRKGELDEEVCGFDEFDSVAELPGGVNLGTFQLVLDDAEQAGLHTLFTASGHKLLVSRIKKRAEIDPVERLVKTASLILPLLPRDVSLHYDSESDMLIAAPATESVVHYIDEHLALLYDPDTLEVAGFQIEAFCHSFLKAQ